MVTRGKGRAVGWCVAAAVAGLAGCGVEKSRNPLSPSIAGPIEGVTISAPAPVMLDAELIRVTDQPITLQFNAATSDSERPFWYEIELSTSNTFDSLVHENRQVEPSGGPTESYRIPVLDAERQYFWRVRALDGANTGPYSEQAAFEVYTPVTVGRPEPVSPVGATPVDGLSATLTVRNARVTGPARNVRYEFQWATDVNLSQGVGTATAPAGDANTSTTLSDLEYETRYYWRGRALADGREPDPIVGAWSQTASFTTPPEPQKPLPPEPPVPPLPPTSEPCRGGNPPNMHGVVHQVARDYPHLLRNSCQEQGGSWEFMDRLVGTLRQYSQCWGYNCKRGDCSQISHDVVDYYRGSGDGNGSTNVAIIDVIANHCTANPQPSWTDLTEETRRHGSVGRWKYPRPR